MLKDGNHRFVTGAPVLGKVDCHMREALALKGQAPHTAVVGCADSRVPLETVFDALPGDLFVLRNAGNTCVWLGSFQVSLFDFLFLLPLSLACRGLP